MPDVSNTTRDDALVERAARIVAQLDALLRADNAALMATVDPAYVAQRYAQGLEQFAAGRYHEAGIAFGDATAAAPGVARHHFAFGLCLQQCGLVREAADQFGAALALDATDAAAAFRLGECFYAQTFYDDAREALRMAIRLCELPDAAPDVRPHAEALIDRMHQEGH